MFSLCFGLIRAMKALKGLIRAIKAFFETLQEAFFREIGDVVKALFWSERP